MQASVLLPTLLFVLAAGPFTLAQTATTACPRKQFMDQCLVQSEMVLESCGRTDTCLCTQYKLQAQCYLQCPNDAPSQQLRTKTLEEAQKRCTGTNNAARAPPITIVQNVTLQTETTRQSNGTDFGKVNPSNVTQPHANSSAVSMVMHGKGVIVGMVLASLALGV